jgi:hypothetical protein
MGNEMRSLDSMEREKEILITMRPIQRRILIILEHPKKAGDTYEALWWLSDHFGQISPFTLHQHRSTIIFLSFLVFIKPQS